jgi:hypothetical protein
MDEKEALRVLDEHGHLIIEHHHGGESWVWRDETNQIMGHATFPGGGREPYGIVWNPEIDGIDTHEFPKDEAYHMQGHAKTTRHIR